MTYSVALPIGGLAGWSLLNKTAERQQSGLQADAQFRRETAYFREKIGGITKAADLVADRTLLKVALTAFGLEGDLQNKAFLRRVLEDGTLKPEALANRLADKRYLEFSKAFGFGDFKTPRTKLSDFADTVLKAYGQRNFEAAVGQQNDDYRLLLNARRELPKIAAKSGTEAMRWYLVMGNPPLRKVVETALKLPASLGRLSLETQLTVFKARTASAFGSSDPSQFATSAGMERLERRFLAMSETASMTRSQGSTALTLLGRGQR